MSIIVVANIHRFEGHFLGSLQYEVSIPIVEIHRRRPRSPDARPSEVTQNEVLA